MLNTLVPHIEQLPWIAGFPFLRVMLWAFFMSLFARHLKQYACMNNYPDFRAKTYSGILLYTNLHIFIETNVNSFKATLARTD
jgi:hypothetical protein